MGRFLIDAQRRAIHNFYCKHAVVLRRPDGTDLKLGLEQQNHKNMNQTLRQFVLLGVISLAAATGTNAARAAGPTAKLTVTVNGRGSVSPTYKGKALNIGQDYPIKATAAAGFAFSDWIETSPTNTLTNTNAKLTFQMVSNLQLTANFVDTQPPTVAITTKKSTGSNSVVAISGTAKDNVGVASVWCQVGSGGWSLAATGNEYTNWTAVVILSEGANTINVYAEDAAGNRSKTNSVTLTDASIGLVAPESLAGTTWQGVETNNNSREVLSFGANTFSEVGSGGDAHTGVGSYTYTLSDAKTGQLAVTLTAPPTTVSNSEGGDVITLSFTNGTSGTWTNLFTNSGTFTLSDASSTAPDAISGVSSANAGTNVVQFTNVFGDGTFTTTTTNGSSSGAYTYAQYSPTAGLVQESPTNEADLGTTNYIVLNFSTGSNTYYLESDVATGVLTNAGTFSVAGETSTTAYTAPASVAGLVGTVTVAHNGKSESFVISLGASTFAQFSADTNNIGVGPYTYTRTGTKTALFVGYNVAPPAAVGDNTPPPFTFTSSHSATFSNSKSHGTVTFSQPASTVPLSLVGRTISGGKGGYSFGYGTFSGIKEAEGQSGNYTYTTYGPQVAMIIMSYTDAKDSGTTDYLMVRFSSAAGGSYVDSKSSGSVSTGTFTMK